MLREKAVEKGLKKNDKFRWRGERITRIEEFSDAVFAITITLLVVSLEVPKTFDQLMTTMRGFFSFAASFALLSLIWLSHYLFFRRYGLKDSFTMLLNIILLFVVMFYAYPLKFLFDLLYFMFTGQGTGGMILMSQMDSLMRIYAIGYMTVFIVFILFHYNAHRRRVELELTELEIMDTRIYAQEHAVYFSTGLLSFFCTFLPVQYSAAVAGFAYSLTGPAQWVNGYVMSKKRDRLVEELEKEEDEEGEGPDD